MAPLTSLALQLCLAAVAFAAPLADHQIKTLGMNPGQQYGTGGGIVGFIVLVLDIIIWIEVLKSSRPPSHKILWCVLVFIFPVVGALAYWVLSDRKKWNDQQYEVLP
ncbi:hypothetical protein LTR09_007478 [Extremus antarcticus]|uniref:Cardiolipin synthase N-terminal domain-containing protein n=1 Tax=Extremus antarcticus TaxID=702011 RepID=A0AAJ0DK54_9PEZI|nr:hypothetical protein LTR09_007478 [Extremus antarcticus]